jgi:tetratricopeptide (TPR) repeat protein
VGILFLIGSLVLRWTEQSKKKFYLIIALVVSIFTVINFSRQKAFANDIVFWEDAVSGSPDNAYAHMLLGVRYTQKNKLPEAYIQFQKAYAINPSERYLNHYMGLMFLNNKKPDTSINYFEKDIELNGLHDSHFHLARAYFETGNKSKAIAALEKYIVLRPNDAMANNNLMLLYSEIGNREKLNSHIHQMQLMGMQVPTEILQQVGQ